MKLNLGSGQRPFGEGWTNIDSNPKWHPDVVADCMSMPMFEDDSAEMIVSHHNLEHFGCGEAAPMIRECHRILKPGGSLIVCVPDMIALARGFLQSRISTQIYLTNLYGAYMDDEADRHKWGYTANSLRLFLVECGFHILDVVDFDNRPIPGASIANDWWILAVEASKW